MKQSMEEMGNKEFVDEAKDDDNHKLRVSAFGIERIRRNIEKNKSSKTQ